MSSLENVSLPPPDMEEKPAGSDIAVPLSERDVSPLDVDVLRVPLTPADTPLGIPLPVSNAPPPPPKPSAFFVILLCYVY